MVGRDLDVRDLDVMAEVTRERCAKVLWKKGKKLSGPKSRKQGGVLIQ